MQCNIVLQCFLLSALITPGTAPENNMIRSQEEKPLFSFGLISDVQYSDRNHLGNRYYRYSLDKLEEAVSVFKKDSVDFIVNLGDLIENNYESYKPVLNLINSSGVKAYHITGNHDYSVEPRYLSRLPVLSGSKEGYFSVIYPNYRLIFLNGNEISTYVSADRLSTKQAGDYLLELRKRGAINAIEWNGGIGSAQREWMAGQLDEALKKSEKVIFLCHFPVAPENIHNLLNYSEINSLLSKYTNIVAWLSGHNHAGNYEHLNNIHYVTFKGMVETRNENSFAIVEAYGNRLIIKGYGRENSLVMNF